MDTKTWRQTYTGGAFDLLSPRAEDVSIQDIAHSLSNLCRYNGHSLRHYSVAEHSVLVATYAQAVLHKSPVEILHALLHDAGEAYTGDIATPMKEAVPALRPFLKKIDAVVLGAFGLPPEKPEWLDEVDRRIRHDEKAYIMSKEPADWGLDPAGPLGVIVQCWDAGFAERTFLVAYQNLKQAIGTQQAPHYDPRCALCGPAAKKSHIGKCKVRDANA